MTRIVLITLSILISNIARGQIRWENVDHLFADLPSSVHIYRTTQAVEGKPNIAYYIIADLRSKKLEFSTDTTYKRRLTPAQFFERNNKPLVVVNGTFFSFQTNQNLNVVIKENKLVSYNVHSVPGRGKDTFTFRHPLGSAIGLSKDRKADVAWLYTDSVNKKAYAIQKPLGPIKDSASFIQRKKFDAKNKELKEWKMTTAIGGGPVLVQNGVVMITNNEELKFAGNAVNDRHPRTAMGYTRDQKLVIMVVQGRTAGVAEGVSLKHLAEMLRDVGCVEALNLDGGGSSCMLVNGKETIKPSDPNGQRPVPAVFIISMKR